MRMHFIHSKTKEEKDQVKRSIRGRSVTGYTGEVPHRVPNPSDLALACGRPLCQLHIDSTELTPEKGYKPNDTDLHRIFDLGYFFPFTAEWFRFKGDLAGAISRLLAVPTEDVIANFKENQPDM